MGIFTQAYQQQTGTTPPAGVSNVFQQAQQQTDTQSGTLPKPNLLNGGFSLQGLGQDASHLISQFPGQELGKAVGTSAQGLYEGIKTGSMQPIEEANRENNANAGKVIGDGINAAATPATLLMGGGEGASALSRVGNAALKYGAAGGVLSGSHTAAQGGTAGDVIKSGAVGTATGIVGGAVGQGLSEGIASYKANKAQSDFIDKMITPPTEKGKAGLNAIKTGKVTEGQGAFGSRNFSKALPNYDEVKASVSQVPGLSPSNSNLENLNAIHENIGSTAENLKGQLGAETSSFTPKEFNKYMKGAKDSLLENPTIVGDAETTANKILDKFNSFVAKNGYTPEGLLNARQELDSWIGSQKPTAFDPKTENAMSTALRAIRQGGNNFLAKLAPNVEVKDLLQHQTNLYDAIETLAPKAQKEGASYIERLMGTFKSHPVGSALTSGAVGVEAARKVVTGHF